MGTPRLDRSRSLSLIGLLLTSLAAAAPGFHWQEAVPGHHFVFPRDHFDHPDFRTEWWYYTGNVQDDAGSRFGFELVFFRQGQERNAGANPSAWRIDDLYLAHAALTQVNGQKFFYEERLNRAGPGIAGISFAQQRVWNGNWSAQWAGEAQHLNAITPHFDLSLDLRPLKAAIVNGVDGVSQKAEGRGKASYYVSLPRLQVAGNLTSGGKKFAVHGSAWMDHEWFTHQLETDQIGWDWFSVQLDNHTELMLFQLRRKDGSIDPNSAGTYVDAAGQAHHLKAADFHLTPLEKWTRYPVHWRIAVPSLNFQLDCRAALDNQELRASKGGTTYWEGAVNYTGTSPGVGYLEMTGYDKAVTF